MLQRALATLLCLLGIAAIGLAVASATVWRPADTLVASVRAADGLVTTDPGVLDLAAESVTVSARSASGEVVLAIGRAEDVTAWVGETSATRVSGLSSRTTLASSSGVATPTPTPSLSPSADASASADPSASSGASAAAGKSTGESEPTATDDAGSADETEPPPNPDGSDLWVQQAVGTRAAELFWSGVAGRWSAIAVATEGGPVTLELTWPQEVTTPWRAPGIVVGSLLLLAGLAWWVVLLVGQHRPDAVLGLVATVARRRRTPGDRRSQRGRASGQHDEDTLAPVSGDAPDARLPSPAPSPAPTPAPAPAPAPAVLPTAEAPRGQPSGSEPGAEPVPTTRRALREQRERAEREPRERAEREPQASAEPEQQESSPSEGQLWTGGAPEPRVDAPQPGRAQTTSPGPAWGEIAAEAPETEPEPRRRRFPFTGRRHSETPAPTPPAPVPLPDLPPILQEPPTVAGTGSADAWRRAWGLPSGGSTWTPHDGTTDGPTDDGRSANPGEGR